MTRTHENNQRGPSKETGTSEIWLAEDGIARVLNKPNSVQGLDEAKENIAALRDIVGDRKIPLLVDGTGTSNMTRDARLFYASEEAGKTVKAQALLLRSPVSKVIGNFMLGLYKPPFPMRIFTTEGEALNWLEQFVEY